MIGQLYGDLLEIVTLPTLSIIAAETTPTPDDIDRWTCLWKSMSLENLCSRSRRKGVCLEESRRKFQQLTYNPSWSAHQYENSKKNGEPIGYVCNHCQTIVRVRTKLKQNQLLKLSLRVRLMMVGGRASTSLARPRHVTELQPTELSGSHVTKLTTEGCRKLIEERRLELWMVFC